MSQEYFYVRERRVDITRREGLIAVRFDPRTPVDKMDAFREAFAADLESTEELSQMQQSNLRLYRISPGLDLDTRDLVRRVRAAPEAQAIGKVYVTKEEQVLVLTDEIVCRFRPEMGRADVERIMDRYALEIVKTLTFSENAFVLRVKPEAGHSALDVANALVEQGMVLYGYPNMIEYVGERRANPAIAAERTGERHGIHPADARLGEQWHHENVGQTVAGTVGTPGADICSTVAWQTTMGSPDVRIAVIDSGVDIAHTDLSAPGKCTAPINFTVNPLSNDPTGNSHGTKVAGMAVATANNGCAGAGSAPDCRLIAVNVGNTLNQVVMAQGFVYAADHGADVITCSLGPFDAWIMTDVLREAIDYATTYGRGGRGIPCFQAVSNYSLRFIFVDEVSSYERTIAVSRTTNQDVYDKAAIGPELDLCAPGRDVLTITNTTLSNACTFALDSGTSYAAPLAAGVAGLVLSLNPDLSWEEVRQVLLDSADKIDAARIAYSFPPAGRPPGTWNEYYGYGRVNAQRAVELAQTGSTRDLYLKDTSWDTGTVPQPRWGFWDSPDIWVRNADDDGATHQNAIHGQDNYVYARVHNRGSEASLPCWVHFYITTFAGTEFRYPYDYKLDTTAEPAGGTPGNRISRSQFPAEGAYLLGVNRVESIPAGSSMISKACWNRDLIPPPDTNRHPCPLVDISPHDGPAPAGVYTWENNNLGQKNVAIVDTPQGQVIELPFQFSHPLADDPSATLSVYRPGMPQSWELFLDVQDPVLLQSIADGAGIALPASPPTSAELVWGPNRPIWAIASLGGANVIALNPNLPTTWVQVPLAHPGRKPLSLKVSVPADAPIGQSRTLDVTQRNNHARLIGGVRFQINVGSSS